MKSNKKLFAMMVALILVISLVLPLAGCGKTETKAPDAAKPADTAKEAPKVTVGSAPPPKNAEVIIKIGHTDTEISLMDSHYFAYTQVFKSIVEGKTGGRIGVQVFPNSQLGDIRSMLQQCIRGDIQMVAGAGTADLASYDPNIQVLNIPYNFASTEVGRKVFAGDFGKGMHDEILAKTKLNVINWLPSSFRNFSNSKKEIKTPEDMKGLKMRTMENPVDMAMMKALGTNPTPISFAELYSALQTGAVDGQENAPYVLLMVKLQEVQKFYTLDGHTLNTAIVVMNDDFLKKLKPEDQQIIKEAASEAELAFLGTITATNGRDIQTLEKAGVKIYYPTPAELAKFKQATQGPVIDYLKTVVDPAWLDRVNKDIQQANKDLGITG